METRCSCCGVSRKITEIKIPVVSSEKKTIKITIDEDISKFESEDMGRIFAQFVYSHVDSRFAEGLYSEYTRLRKCLKI